MIIKPLQLSKSIVTINILIIVIL